MQGVEVFYLCGSPKLTVSVGEVAEVGEDGVDKAWKGSVTLGIARGELGKLGDHSIALEWSL